MQQGVRAGERLVELMGERLDVLRAKSGMTGNHAQEMLSAVTGIGRQTINGYCRNRLGLGSDNAQRIADALDVTVADLGLPEATGNATGPTSLPSLRELSDTLERALQQQAKLTRQVARLQARVQRLEARPAPGADDRAGTGTDG